MHFINGGSATYIFLAKQSRVLIFGSFNSPTGAFSSCGIKKNKWIKPSVLAFSSSENRNSSFRITQFIGK